MDYSPESVNMDDGSYDKYISSDLWKTIRKRILLRDKGLCQCINCTEKATDVHHMSYGAEVLRGERDGELLSLCEECHRRAHANGRGNLEKINRWIKTGSIHKDKKRLKIMSQQKQEKRWTNWKTR
jgi:5-methylcytosine-specific restriction endonuclease McrA